MKREPLSNHFPGVFCGCFGFHFAHNFVPGFKLFFLSLAFLCLKMASNRPSLPGIDDEDDDQQDNEVIVTTSPSTITTNGKRAICALEDLVKRQRTDTVDDEDEFLYGSGDQEMLKVSNDTNQSNSKSKSNIPVLVFKSLEGEELPTSLSSFISHIFSTILCDKQSSELEQSRLKTLLQSLSDVRCLENQATFQVAVISSLLLEVRKRVKECVERSEFIQCNLYMRKEVKDNLMKLNCFVTSSVKSSPTFSAGQLFQVVVIQTGMNPKVENTVGYALNTYRRCHELCIFKEDLLLRRNAQSKDKILIEEVELLIPNLEIIKTQRKITLRIIPTCHIRDILMEANSVYDINDMILFKFLQSRIFSVLPSGIPVSSNPLKFSSSQLEAIQRSFDLLVEPATNESDPPFNAVVLNGFYRPLRASILEILCEFMKNPTTDNLQFVVVSECDKSLNCMFNWLRKKLRHLRARDILLVGGKESIREQRDYAKQYMRNEISMVDKRLVEIKDVPKTDPFFAKSRVEMKELETKKDVLSRSLAFLESIQSESLAANILTTTEEFLTHSFGYQFSSARILLTSFSQVSQKHFLSRHLKSKNKVYGIQKPSESSSQGNHRRRLSHCVILDSKSMSDSRAISFLHEFKFMKMIATSSWIASPPSSLPPNISSSFFDRLISASETDVNSMVIEVTGETDKGKSMSTDSDDLFMDSLEG